MNSNSQVPVDSLVCARLAAAVILATTTAPDHPLVLGGPQDLAKTVDFIERLLEHAARDPELVPRVRRMRDEWSLELARLGVLPP